MGQPRNGKINKKYMETNKNDIILVCNLWDRAEAVLRGKFIVIQAYLKIQEKSQINSLTLNRMELKQKQTNPKASIRKKIINIRAEISEINTKQWT